MEYGDYRSVIGQFEQWGYEGICAIADEYEDAVHQGRQSRFTAHANAH